MDVLKDVPNMKIAYHRDFGFATNSSSTHHIVRRKRNVSIDSLKTYVPDDNEFGWGTFTLYAQEDKLRYLTQLMRQTTFKALELEEAKKSIIALIPEAEPVIEYLHKDDYGIDHQSIPSMPNVQVHGAGLEVLWKLFYDQVVKDDDVLIFGGSDNDDNHPHMSKVTMPKEPIYGYTAYMFSPGYGNTKFLYDSTGFMSFFNTYSGEKMRTRYFGTDYKPIFSSVPELVDLKITNKCSKGCKFCYQKSIPDGEHAKLEDILTIIKILGEAGTFEIALGGGEPLDHPNIIEILEACKKSNIVPNISTATLDWVDKHFLIPVINACVGGIGYSTNNIADIAKFHKALDTTKTYGMPGTYKYGTIHYVLGLSPLDNLREFLKVAYEVYVPVVLLKFKPVGRGADFEQYPFDGWWDIVKKSEQMKYAKSKESRHDNRILAIDSFLAEDVSKYLGDMIDDLTYEVGDGKFSMYYDAVAHTAAPHSFAKGVDCKPEGILNYWIEDKHFGMTGEALVLGNIVKMS